MTNATYQATVYIAGDVADIKRVCQEFCFDRDPCVAVTVSQTEFVYSGVSETGAAIGFINYPRFPAKPEEILGNAVALARLLLLKLYQRSCTVVASDVTTFIQNPNYRHKA